MAGCADKDTDYRFKVVPLDTGSADADVDACARAARDARQPLGARHREQRGPAPRRPTTSASGTATASRAELDTGRAHRRHHRPRDRLLGPSAPTDAHLPLRQHERRQVRPRLVLRLRAEPRDHADQIVYTDAERLPHTFTGSGSVWTAPNGFLAGARPDGSNWRLTFFDQSYLTFDSAGKLIARDRRPRQRDHLHLDGRRHDAHHRRERPVDQPHLRLRQAQLGELRDRRRHAHGQLRDGLALAA